MNSNEVGVVIVLGLVGYWGTSALIKFFKKESEWTSKQQKSYSHQEEYRTETPKRENLNQHWYEILGVLPTASLDEIKTAYKKKISMYHPDKVSSMGPEFNEIAQKKSKEINSAYDEAIRIKNL